MQWLRHIRDPGPGTRDPGPGIRDAAVAGAEVTREKL